MRSSELREDKHPRHGSRALAISCVVVLGAATLSACGSSTKATSPPVSQTTTVSRTTVQSPKSKEVGSIAALVPSEIRKHGALSVASEIYPPAVLEGANNKPQGWEVDLGKAIGNVLGLKMDFHIVQFSALLPGLQSGKYEIGMGDISISPERERQVDFVSDHAAGNSFMVLRSSTVDVKNLHDLCGRTVAVLIGSVEATTVETTAKECATLGLKPLVIRQFETQPEVNLALKSGRVQVDVASTGTLGYVIKEEPGQFKITGEYGPENLTGTAIAKKSWASGLAKAIRAATIYLIKDGTYNKIFKKWDDVYGEIPAKLVQINPTKELYNIS